MNPDPRWHNALGDAFKRRKANPESEYYDQFLPEIVSDWRSFLADRLKNARAFRSYESARSLWYVDRQKIFMDSELTGDSEADKRRMDYFVVLRDLHQQKDESPLDAQMRIEYEAAFRCDGCGKLQEFTPDNPTPLRVIQSGEKLCRECLSFFGRR
jgi:hypothetical protein